LLSCSQAIAFLQVPQLGMPYTLIVIFKKGKGKRGKGKGFVTEIFYACFAKLSIVLQRV
jgi:hypothetical protein